MLRLDPLKGNFVIRLRRGRVPERHSLPILALVIAFLHAPGLPAQSDSPLPPGRPPEFGAEAGYGFSIHLNRGRSVEHFWLLEPWAGVRVSSRLQYVVEAHLARHLTPRGYVVGLMPVGGRLFIGSGRALPYVSIGGGFGWTDLTSLEEIDRRFNFLLQASAGVRYNLSEKSAWTFEARLAHISNGGTARPNLGLNNLVFLGGFRFR